MNFEEEISLLIKSRYPLVAVDTIDEEYVLGQLYAFCRSQGLTFYSWSLTKGLRIGRNENSFYKTNEAVAMLRIANDLVQEPHSSVFALSDFDRYLGDAAVSRYFKDLLNRIKGTPTTIVMLGSEIKLTPDIAPMAARIHGGYPSEMQIMDELNRSVAQFRLTAPRLKVDLPPEALRRVVKTLRGLSLQQIRNALNLCMLKDGSFDISDLREIEKYKKDAFDRDGVLEYFGSETPDQIAGFDNLKRWVWRPV